MLTLSTVLASRTPRFMAGLNVPIVPTSRRVYLASEDPLIRPYRYPVKGNRMSNTSWLAS
jgi:hypothetical protein